MKQTAKSQEQLLASLGIDVRQQRKDLLACLSGPAGKGAVSEALSQVLGLQLVGKEPHSPLLSTNGTEEQGQAKGI